MDEDESQGVAAIEQAARNLAHARCHAIWLERLAAMVAAFAACTGLAVAVGSSGLAIWPALGTALVGGAAWGILRGLGLLLHLRVDETMVHLADEVEAAPPTG